MRTLHKGLSEKQAVTLPEGMGFIRLNPFFSGGGFITGVVFVAAALLSQFVGIFYRSLYCPKCGAKMQKSGKDNSDPLIGSSPRPAEVQKSTFVSGRGGAVSVDNVLSIV